jgi:hypothetical protein
MTPASARALVLVEIMGAAAALRIADALTTPPPPAAPP